MKRLGAGILTLAILTTGCASQSEIADLEQRIADLEAVTEETIQDTDTRPLPIVLTTRASISDTRCYIASTSRGTADVNSADFAQLEDGSGNIYDRVRVRGPAVDKEAKECEFNFTFPQAPADIPFYAITIANDATWTFTRTDIEDQDWNLRLNGTG